MPTEPTISAIAHVIQLSVAPVFLLSGIAAILGVMAARLARVVDRARVIEEQVMAQPLPPGPLHEELAALSRRAQIISLAIGLCTTTALLISAVIAVLFLSALFSFETSPVVASLFVAAMLTLIAALILLLREILVATAGLRFGPR